MKLAVIEHVVVAHDVYSTEEQEAGWLYSLLPEIVVTTNECSEYLYSAFKDPDQYYDLWVYGFVWMQVYFQVGMIIGDTEQHNKQYMWLLWRKWLT